MKVTRAAVACCLLLIAVHTVLGQAIKVSEAQARDWATYSAQKSGGDPKAFGEAFMPLVRILAPEYGLDPFNLGVTVYRTDALDITVLGQVAVFHTAFAERIRKMESTDSVPWRPGVFVVVWPRQIGSPDIEKIVLKRNGVIVEPVSTTLRVTNLSTASGATRSIHQGDVAFPASAFAPGAEVVLIAIPAAGENIVWTFKESELKKIV